MDYKKHIISNPSVMLGKPVIKGTRITVDLVLKKLSEGATIQQLLEAYPSLKKQEVLAVLAYASDVIANESMISFS